MDYLEETFDLRGSFFGLPYWSLLPFHKLIGRMIFLTKSLSFDRNSGFGWNDLLKSFGREAHPGKLLGLVLHRLKTSPKIVAHHLRDLWHISFGPDSFCNF